MQIQTNRFGRVETVEVPEEAIFAFPVGLPGFENSTEFALIEDDRYEPFCWLQSLEEPAVGFVVVDPNLVVADYELEVGDEDAGMLQLASDAPLLALCVLVILVVHAETATLTANLKAPVVLNLQARRGGQVILDDDRYPLRYRLDLDLFQDGPPRRQRCSF